MCSREAASSLRMLIQREICRGIDICSTKQQHGPSPRYCVREQGWSGGVCVCETRIYGRWGRQRRIIRRHKASGGVRGARGPGVCFSVSRCLLGRVRIGGQALSRNKGTHGLPAGSGPLISRSRIFVFPLRQSDDTGMVTALAYRWCPIYHDALTNRPTRQDSRPTGKHVFRGVCGGVHGGDQVREPSDGPSLLRVIWLRKAAIGHDKRGRALRQPVKENKRCTTAGALWLSKTLLHRVRSFF
jgi:hypothetical protein